MATQTDTTSGPVERASATLIFVPRLGHVTGNSADSIATSLATVASLHGDPVIASRDRLPTATKGLTAVATLMRGDDRLLDIAELFQRSTHLNRCVPPGRRRSPWRASAPCVRTCIPCSWAQARTASDCPRGAVLAATPDADRFRGAPGRPWAGARRAAFLPEALLTVDFETGDSAAALVAGVRLAADFLVALAEGFLDPASPRPAPEADRLSDSSATAPPELKSTASGTAGDSSALRAKRCRP